jgi:hypothetical protein
LGNPTEIFRAHGLQAEPAVNPHVRAAIPNSPVILDVTDGVCSCRLRPQATADEAVVEGAERARYARKGWSAAKIARAIEAKRATRGRHKSSSSPQSFCLSVEALVRSGSEVAIISHFYHGSFAEEVLSVGARASMSLNDFVGSLSAFPDDTLVTVE